VPRHVRVIIPGPTPASARGMLYRSLTCPAATRHGAKVPRGEMAFAPRKPRAVAIQGGADAGYQQAKCMSRILRSYSACEASLQCPRLTLADNRRNQDHLQQTKGGDHGIFAQRPVVHPAARALRPILVPALRSALRQ